MRTAMGGGGAEITVLTVVLDCPTLGLFSSLVSAQALFKKFVLRARRTSARPLDIGDREDGRSAPWGREGLC